MQVPKVAFCIIAAVAFSHEGYAFDTDQARTAAMESLRSQLSVRLSAQPNFGAALDLTAAAAGPDDPIADRLEGVFALVAPDAAGEALIRLPRPRPEPEAEALAYAEPARPKSGGLSAIQDLVAEHAEANDVPPALALALVQVESSYNPKATGANGEIGLLQISPKTARAIGYKGSPKALYDPETNLSWGMKYLGKAHKLADGDTCGTLARYNAGLDARPKKGATSKFCAKVKSVIAARA
jgi:soluble lytic murein transglycosylase-like protein